MSKIMFKSSCSENFTDVTQSKNIFFAPLAVPSFKFLSLRKNNGANPQNVLLMSASLTLLSLLITWMVEILANEILLHY